MSKQTTTPTERDELTQIIDDRWHGYGYNPQGAAEAILAAGYRKPRTVTTVEELDALAEHAVILSDEGGVFEHEHGWWRVTGSRDPMASSELALPATVLHEGVSE